MPDETRGEEPGRLTSSGAPGTGTASEASRDSGSLADKAPGTCTEDMAAHAAVAVPDEASGTVTAGFSAFAGAPAQNVSTEAPGADLTAPLSRKRRALRVLEPICLLAVPLAMVLLAAFHVPQFNVISAAIATVCMVPFFVDFEASQLRARDLMPIVVMSALAVAGRLVFAPLPAVKPITAIVIITAMSFGRQAGFLTGALSMLVSNIFFGQGPWTPWQMYSFGLVGYLSGIFAERGWLKANRFLYVYGFTAAYFYGAIMDSWTFFGFVQPWTVATALATYGAGAIYNLGHAIGTVLFLIPIARTWPAKFERVKLRYGLGARLS